MSSQLPKGYIQPLPIRARESRPQPKGLPIINLSFNELPYSPTAHVQQAIRSATEQANLYGNPSCELLRQALGTQHGLNPEKLICGNGSEELLDIIGRVYARSGDNIVIPEYGYIQFPIVANRVGADLVKVPETEFTTDIDALLRAVDGKTRIVFLANPNNPTATMIPAVEIRRLANSLPSQVVLVVDLAYGEFASSGYCDDMHKLVEDAENVIVTRTFSKAFGLAGLRVGWCHAPEHMIPSLYAARGMGTVNAAAQAAAIGALEDNEITAHRIQTIVHERDALARSLTELGMEVTPSCANFLMATTPDATALTADALANHLFDDVGILVNRTREAGLEKFIRFSIGLPEHNAMLKESIERFSG
ncbi:MAG: aminotransferase class I/II-fold pyridoxal phosphate-dependent enzyme [Gammaproteobacteria bacterium]|nr:aminotransferase class I/II-fold pyridoxal phosphate-dependent enzyme [Gammaproteobacteria bacterium]